jgi:energy-coupling factor transporter ATP-binding protein EcfA2
VTVIVNIAGTSGSGKSTVVRQLLAAGRHTMPKIDRGRDIGFITYIGDHPIYVAGRYGVHDTAGCDCIKDVEFWYETILEQARVNHVVYEGLFVMNHKRGLELMPKIEGIATMHIINLTTPWAVCRDSINERRQRRGQDNFDGNQRNLEGHMVRAKNFAFKLRQLGALTYNLDREAAVVKLKELVG